MSDRTPDDGGLEVEGLDLDPDDLDLASMALVAEAVSFLRAEATPPAGAVDQVVQRVRLEAFLGQVAGTIFGSLGRVGRAVPDLLGMDDPLGPPPAHPRPTDPPEPTP